MSCLRPPRPVPLRFAALVAAAPVLAACSFSVTYDGAGYLCDDDQGCPPGFTCGSDGHCVAQGAEPDGGGPPGGDDDASPPPDGGPPPASACGTTDILRDDFTNGASAWQVTATGGVSFDVLLLGSARFAVANEKGLGSLRSRRAFQFQRSRLEVEVQLEGQDANLGIFDVVVGLTSEADDNAAHIRLRGDRLLAETIVDGRVKSHGELAYQPDVHRHWRLREDNGSIDFEVSPEGTGWIAIGRAASDRLQRPLFASLLVSAIDGPSRPLAVTMDNVNSGPPDDVPWCSVGSLTDDFDDSVRGPEWLEIGPGQICQALEAEGQLILANPVGLTCGYLSALGYRLDDTLTVEATTDGAGSPDLNLEVQIGSERIGLHSHLNDVEEHTLVAYRSAGIPSDGDFLNEEIYEVRQRFWRIRPADDGLVFETAPDLSDFRPFARIDDPLDLSDVRVRLYTTEIGDNEVAMDNLNTR